MRKWLLRWRKVFVYYKYLKRLNETECLFFCLKRMNEQKNTQNCRFCVWLKHQQYSPSFFHERQCLSPGIDNAQGQASVPIFEITWRLSFKGVFDPGGDSTYERGGDAHRKFWIKPLQETNLGVVQAFFLPLKETMLKHRQYTYIYIFRVQP